MSEALKFEFCYHTHSILFNFVAGVLFMHTEKQAAGKSIEFSFGHVAQVGGKWGASCRARKQSETTKERAKNFELEFINSNAKRLMEVGGAKRQEITTDSWYMSIKSKSIR